MSNNYLEWQYNCLYLSYRLFLCLYNKYKTVVFSLNTFRLAVLYDCLTTRELAAVLFSLPKTSNNHTMKTKTTKNKSGLFSTLPQKAVILGSRFVSVSGRKSFEICYSHRGRTITQYITMEGGVACV